MTKADLRTGMVITCRNGRKYVVMTDTYEDDKLCGIGCNKGANWLSLDGYEKDLTYRDDGFDIMKVEVPCNRSDIKGVFKTDGEYNLNVIWTRKKKKKYTYEQLKEILGEEFEIVKE